MARYMFIERLKGRLPLLAISSLVSTVVLILVGSIVRVTGYGLGCPDWPLCYGQAIPPAYTGAWVEFSHRLFGAITSAQILLLAVLAWRWHRRQAWIIRPSILAAGLLLVQIVLGGLHVIMEIPPETGLLHTALAMGIVGLLAVVVASSSTQAIGSLDPAAGLRRYLGGTAVATYLLLLTGSYVTRSGASLACPSFPLCGIEAPAIRHLIDIQMLHRLTAFAVGVLVIGAIVWLRNDANRTVRRLSRALGILLLVQLGLGIANVALLLPMWSRVLHLTTAAAIWSLMAMLWAFRAREQT